MSRPNVFISHSHEDSEWVCQFAEALKELDVAVWFDEWQIKAGDPLELPSKRDCETAMLSSQF